MPCTFDFNVAATKYFRRSDRGEIPLHFLFSGTVFYADADGVLQVAPISWEQEARFKLPVQVWREMMDAYYPEYGLARTSVATRSIVCTNTRLSVGILTWEQALESMLPAEETVNS